jgi:hypothetical protein
MTDRLGLLTRSELNAEQQQQYDAFAAYTTGKYDGMYVTDSPSCTSQSVQAIRP